MSAVQVLPSSRPEARSWASVTRPRPRLPAVVARPAAPVEPPAGPVRVGQVCLVGRGWAAGVSSELPDGLRWSGWLAVVLGETLLGRRSPTQLAGWVTREVLAGLHRRQRLRRAEDRLAPRAVLVSGRVQHPSDRAAEVVALVRAGQRLLVLAFRLEAVGTQWVCCALDVGMPEPGSRGRRPA